MTLKLFKMKYWSATGTPRKNAADCIVVPCLSHVHPCFCVATQCFSVFLQEGKNCMTTHKKWLLRILGVNQLSERISSITSVPPNWELHLATLTSLARRQIYQCGRTADMCLRSGQPVTILTNGKSPKTVICVHQVLLEA